MKETKSKTFLYLANFRAQGTGGDTRIWYFVLPGGFRAGKGVPPSTGMRPVVR